MATPTESLRERLWNVDYAKYRTYVYNFTTFVSALIVLVISIAILTISILMYPKIKHVFVTIENVEDKIDELTTMSWVDIVKGIIEVILGLVTSLAATSDTRVRVRTEVMSRLRPGHEYADAMTMYNKLVAIDPSHVRSQSDTATGIMTVKDAFVLLDTLLVS